MKGCLKSGIIFCLLTFDIFHLNGQVDDLFIKSLKDKLASYTSKVPFEDIYLHTDREIYIAGEYLWFNAYLFNRNNLSLSSESSYAYIELLNPDNQPVSHTKVRLSDGTGGGGFRLPDSLYTGEYTLRAYTSLMKNFLPSGCFMKRVTVYNPFSDNIFRTIREKITPVISRSGYSLNVKSDRRDSLILTVNIENVSGVEMNYFYFVVVSNGKIIYSEKKSFSEKISRFSFPGNTLNPGINQITLFDPNGNPVCNRCVFRPFSLNNNVFLQTKRNFKKREKIDLEISIDSTLISNQGMTGFSLSVSAINEGKMSSDILEYLIAGDEFRSEGGPVLIDPELFKSSPEMIDNFLLTVKSNWILWEEILKEKSSIMKYPSEKGIQYLSGFYKNNNSTETNFKKLLYISMPGKIPIFRYSETDSENHFSFAIRDNELSEEYIIQSSEPDNNYSVQVESPFSVIYPKSQIINDSSGGKLPETIANWSVNYQVEKIYGISNLVDTIRSEHSKTSRIRFYGKPDQEVVMSNYISLPAMQEVFVELIPGVSIKTKKSKHGIFVQDPVTKNYYDNPPLLLVDGVIINDPSEIINLDPELVEKIDIIKDDYIVGDIIFSGIISVITKAGDFTSVSLPPNAIRINDKSSNYIKKFRLPDYSKATENNDRIPDFRNTLFWIDNLKPDSRGKIYISFPASDFASNYEIILQGASGSRLFSAKRTIHVE